MGRAETSEELNRELATAEVGEIITRGGSHRVFVDFFRLLANRQAKPEDTSLSEFAPNADLSLVRFHGEPAKGETNAGGMALLRAAVGLTEFLEDVRMLIGRDAWPIVTH